MLSRRNFVAFMFLFSTITIYSQVGIIIGEDGTLLKTSNSGSTWIQKQAGTAQILWNSFFLNDNTGWIAGGDYSDSSIILKTTNGGESWVKQFTQPGFWLTGVIFLTPQKGFVIGSLKKVFMTTNGGSNWVQVNMGIGSDLLESISFFDDMTGIITGWSGIILRTTDGGISWNSANSGTNSNLYTTFVTSAQSGWAAGVDGTLLRTANKGMTWSPVATGTNIEIFSLVFRDNFGWLTGNNGIIKKSTDFGNTWVQKPISTNTRLETLCFTSNLIGWVVGGHFGSEIYKTTDGGESWVPITGLTSKHLYSVNFSNIVIGIQPVSTVVPGDFRLHQNYPNPFNPSTKISFDIPKLSMGSPVNVSVKIYNELGEEVDMIAEEELSPGTYEVNWDATGFASGVYYCRLLSGEFSSTQKMTLIK